MFAEQQYKLDGTDLASRLAIMLPAVKVSETVHWYEPNGSTRTGQIESLEVIDGVLWASAHYELIPGCWVQTHQHAHNYFLGVGPEFPLQPNQPVWISKRGNGWRACKVADLYLESNVWMVSVEWREWYGITHDELPIDQIRTTQPELDEDPEYSVWLDDRNDLAYEDWRDSRHSS